MIILEIFVTAPLKKNSFTISKSIEREKIVSLVKDEKNYQILKQIAGIINFNGSISVDNTKYISNSFEYKKNFTYIEDTFFFYANVMVIDFLVFWSNLYQTSIIIDAVVTCLDLGEFITKRINQISDDQKLLLSFARAILSKNKYWIINSKKNLFDFSYTESIEGVMDANINSGGIIIINNAQNIKLSTCSMCITS